MTIDTTSQSFFEKIYREEEDPWSFASSDYEQHRYTTIMNALSARPYRNAFEPGCSVGVLTSQLALISGRVYAMDISPTAIERARQRCLGRGNVVVCCGALPLHMPATSFDLIVFSELGYYFDENALAQLAGSLTARLEPNGVLIAAHWLGNSADHILSGDRVHEILKSVSGIEHRFGERHSGFRLDRWVRS
ncbi:MAG: SAM-dependent methyltransferase [Granulicella sp.]